MTDDDRILVWGAGAIGGHAAARLSRGGADVSVIARGPQLDAIRARGLCVEAPDASFDAAVRAAEHPAELGPQDAVLVTDADEIAELVGDMGELAPERRGPVLPRDLLDPAVRQVLAALPARRAARPDDIARTAQTTPDDAIAKLYELRALGYVERHGDSWKLTRQAMISVRGGADVR